MPLTHRLLATALLLLTMGALLPLHAHAERLRVGLSVPTLANPFWERYVAFAETVAEQLEIDLQVLDCRTDDQRQLRDVERLLGDAVDGLLVTPQTVQVGPALITLAQKAATPLVVTDRWPGIDPREYAWDGYVGFIGPDDHDAGLRIGRTLIETLGRRRLVALNGVHGASVAEGRFSGLREALAAAPDAKLLSVDWAGETRDQGRAAMKRAVERFGERIDGVWAYNDSLALGGIDALGDSAAAVVGMDLIPEALERIEQGRYHASFGGHWMQGGFGLIMLYDHLNGYQPNPEYRVVKLKLLKVSAENLARFRAQFIDTAPRFDARAASKALNPRATGKYFFEISLTR